MWFSGTAPGRSAGLSWPVRGLSPDGCDVTSRWEVTRPLLPLTAPALTGRCTALLVCPGPGCSRSFTNIACTTGIPFRRVVFAVRRSPVRYLARFSLARPAVIGLALVPATPLFFREELSSLGITRLRHPVVGVFGFLIVVGPVTLGLFCVVSAHNYLPAVNRAGTEWFPAALNKGV